MLPLQEAGDAKHDEPAVESLLDCVVQVWIPIQAAGTIPGLAVLLATVVVATPMILDVVGVRVEIGVMVAADICDNVVQNLDTFLMDSRFDGLFNIVAKEISDKPVGLTGIRNNPYLSLLTSALRAPR